MSFGRCARCVVCALNFYFFHFFPFCYDEKETSRELSKRAMKSIHTKGETKRKKMKLCMRWARDGNRDTTASLVNAVSLTTKANVQVWGQRIDSQSRINLQRAERCIVWIGWTAWSAFERYFRVWKRRLLFHHLHAQACRRFVPLGNGEKNVK